MTFDADGDLWLYAFTVEQPECQPSGSSCLWEVNKKTAAAQVRRRKRRSGRACVRARRRLRGRPGDLALTGLIGARAHAASSTPRSTSSTRSNGALHKIADAPGHRLPDRARLRRRGRPLGAREHATAAPDRGLGMTLVQIDPNNGNSGPTDVTVNGAPFVRPDERARGVADQLRGPGASGHPPRSRCRSWCSRSSPADSSLTPQPAVGGRRTSEGRRGGRGLVRRLRELRGDT